MWYASDEGKIEIPSEHEWLSCELVAALIEEITGGKSWYSWRHDEFGRERYHDWREWPEILNAKLQNHHRHHQKMFYKMSVIGNIRGLLERFVQYKFQTDRDEKLFTSELKWFHEHHTATYAGCSRFKPHCEIAAKSIEFLGGQGLKLHAEAIEWCRTIGQLMRPYIERDVAYIRKQYHW